MKSIMLRIIGGLVLMISVAVLFTQCETDLNGLDTEATQDLAVETRGTGCPLNPDGPFNPAYQGGGPAISVAELCTRLTDNFPLEELTVAEAKALVFMREEEKMARDVYLALYEKWNIPIFDFISQSEQRHMDAVGCLLTKYQLTDPVEGNPAGVFENEELQGLYNGFVEAGVGSLAAAFTAGANIEDLDIYDLMGILEEVDAKDVKTVFENLTMGSRNHLRAFVRQLINQGVTYEPVYLAPEIYSEIISSTFETGGGTVCGLCPNGTPVGDGVNCDGSGPLGASKQGNMNGNSAGKKMRRGGRR